MTSSTLPLHLTNVIAQLLWIQDNKCPLKATLTWAHRASHGETESLSCVVRDLPEQQEKEVENRFLFQFSLICKEELRFPLKIADQILSKMHLQSKHSSSIEYRKTHWTNLEKLRGIQRKIHTYIIPQRTNSSAYVQPLFKKREILATLKSCVLSKLYFSQSKLATPLTLGVSLPCFSLVLCFCSSADSGFCKYSGIYRNTVYLLLFCSLAIGLSNDACNCHLTTFTINNSF